MHKAGSGPASWNNGRIQFILIWIAAVVMAIAVGLTFLTVHSAKEWQSEIRAGKTILN